MGHLSRMFRLWRSTIHEILDESVPAIHKALKDDYLVVSKDGNGFHLVNMSSMIVKNDKE